MKQHTTDRMAELEWNFMHAPECPDSYISWEDCGEDYDKFSAEHLDEVEIVDVGDNAEDWWAGEESPEWSPHGSDD